MNVEVRSIKLKVGCQGVTGFEEALSRITDALVVTEHFAVNQEGHGWNVTHIPTGLMAAQADEMTVAVEAAKAFERLDVDWNFTHPSGVQGFPAAVKTTAHRIKVLCVQGDLAGLRCLA
ncbi:MAG TPA: hypothetical protein VD865_13050 [Stenotrophomonas sp.]|nr:hypothetical protein [Stenotrophomonas sp.]